GEHPWHARVIDGLLVVLAIGLAFSITLSELTLLILAATMLAGGRAEALRRAPPTGPLLPFARWTRAAAALSAAPRDSLPAARGQPTCVEEPPDAGDARDRVRGAAVGHGGAALRGDAISCGQHGSAVGRRPGCWLPSRGQLRHLVRPGDRRLLEEMHARPRVLQHLHDAGRRAHRRPHSDPGAVARL